MQCPNCAAQITPGQSICPQCSVGLIAPPPPPPVSAAPRPLRFALTVLILIASTALLAWSTFLRYHRELTGEAMGYFLGSLLLPFLIAYAIAGAKRRRNGLWFSLAFLALAIIASFSAFVGREASLTDLPKDQMLETLAGLRPLSVNAPDYDRKTVATTSQLFAEMRQISVDYNARQSQLNQQFPKLYALQTFASRSALQNARSVVQQKLTLDEDTSQKFQHFPDMLRSHLQNSGLSKADQQDFIASVESTFSTSSVMQARADMLTAERKWAAASFDLYDFSMQHMDEMSVWKTSIVISSVDTKKQFDSRYSRALKLRDEFNASAANLARTRDAYMASQGIKLSDVGLKK